MTFCNEAQNIIRLCILYEYVVLYLWYNTNNLLYIPSLRGDIFHDPSDGSFIYVARLISFFLYSYIMTIASTRIVNYKTDAIWTEAFFSRKSVKLQISIVFNFCSVYQKTVNVHNYVVAQSILKLEQTCHFSSHRSASVCLHVRQSVSRSVRGWLGEWVSEWVLRRSVRPPASLPACLSVYYNTLAFMKWTTGDACALSNTLFLLQLRYMLVDHFIYGFLFRPYIHIKNLCCVL